MTNVTLLNHQDAPVVFETAEAESGLIAIATLNAPKSLNALNYDMIQLLEPQLRKWADDDAVAMVILKGAGEKAFCAGGDVVSLHKAMSTGEPANYIEDFLPMSTN